MSRLQSNIAGFADSRATLSNSLVFGHGPCSGAKTTACLYYIPLLLCISPTSAKLVTVTQRMNEAIGFSDRELKACPVQRFHIPLPGCQIRIFSHSYVANNILSRYSKCDVGDLNIACKLLTKCPQRHRYLGHHDHCLCRFWELESCLGLSKINEKTWLSS